MSLATLSNMFAGTHPSQRSDVQWAPHFVLAVWGNRSTSPQLLQHIREAVRTYTPHLHNTLELPGLTLFAEAEPPLSLSTEDRSLIVAGTIFPSSSSPSQSSLMCDLAHAPLPDVPRRLFKTFWGSYLAVVRDNRTGDAMLIRDPSGGIPAHIVDAGGLAVVCDELPGWLVQAIGRPLPIDKDALACALALPMLTTHRSLLRNVVSLAPGAALPWRTRFDHVQQVWDPAAFWGSAPADPHHLRNAVLEAVRHYRSQHQQILLELSGGLDSAVVLGALATVSDVAGVRCVNFATTYAGGDERRTARNAVAKAKVELIEMIAREEEIDYEQHLSGPQPLQPQLYGLDPIVETVVCELAETFGATAIFTGQGGDSVFYQMPTDKVAIDLMRARGLRALLSYEAVNAARRTHASLWKVQWRMLRDGLVGTAPERLPLNMNLLGSTAKSLMGSVRLEHPWLANLSELPPGKQFHVLVLANCQLFNGPTRRRRQFSLIHPLMAQPVIEACLPIPSYDLSYGTNDRALARELFRDILPASISHRRGKGEVSSYYRRALVENLPFLRPFLLDGTLCAHGFIDADVLDELMTEDILMWSDEARLITILASFEAWARHWRL